METLLYQSIQRFEPNLTITVGFSTHEIGGRLNVVRRHSFSCQMFLGMNRFKQRAGNSAASDAWPGALIGVSRKGIRTPAG